MSTPLSLARIRAQVRADKLAADSEERFIDAKLEKYRMSKSLSRSASLNQSHRIYARHLSNNRKRYERNKLVKLAASGNVASARVLEPELRARALSSDARIARNASSLMFSVINPLLGAGSDIIRLVELCCGYGGGLIATEQAYPPQLIHSVHAGDYNKGKIELCKAVFNASAVKREAPEVMDVMKHYTDAIIKAWGVVTLLISSILCIHHSPDGKRGGMKKLRPFLRGLFSVLRRARARIVVLECVTQLASDPEYNKDVLVKLRSMDYFVCTFELCASGWSDGIRKRLYLVCFLDEGAFERFKLLIPKPPRHRETKLSALLLKPFMTGAEDEAPCWVYDISKALKSKKKSKTSFSVGVLSFKGMKKLSAVVRVNRRGDVKKISGARSTIATHTKSGKHYLRDTTGTRALCGREESALHGVPEVYAKAMVTATLKKNTTDNAVVSAIGDGFSIHVLRDIIRALLRASGYCVT